MQAHGDRVRGKEDKLEYGKFKIVMRKKIFTLRMIKCSGRLPGKKWNLHPWRDSVLAWR